MPKSIETINRLCAAVAAIIELAPTMRVNLMGKNWLKCVYCGAQSLRQPIQHRAGCAWAELKAAYDEMMEV